MEAAGSHLDAVIIAALETVAAKESFSVCHGAHVARMRKDSPASRTHQGSRKTDHSNLQSLTRRAGDETKRSGRKTAAAVGSRVWRRDRPARRQHQASLADRGPTGARSQTDMDLEEKGGAERQRNYQTQSRIRSCVSCNRSAIPRSAARRRLALTRGRLAGASRPAHARSRVASADQHLPQRDAARTPRIDAQLGGIARGLQGRCKQPFPRSPAYSQGSSRFRRELVDSLTLGFGGVDGTRARSLTRSGSGVPEHVEPDDKRAKRSLGRRGSPPSRVALWRTTFAWLANRSSRPS
jgi:hypothetical protein